MSGIKVPYNNGSDEWMKEYFPEYHEANDGETQVKSQGPVTSRMTVPEMAPWKFWSDPRIPESKRIDPNGFRYEVDENGTATRVPVSDEEYRAWCDKYNYFRNGGRTPYGGPGLDPTVFHASILQADKSVLCPGGVYRRGDVDVGDVQGRKENSFTPSTSKEPSYISDTTKHYSQEMNQWWED